MFDPKIHLFHINSSVIITNPKGEVLMGRRSQDEEKSQGLWTIPGGKLDAPDGSIENGLTREVKEEVGIDIKELTLFRNYIALSEEKNSLYLIFKAKSIGSKAKALEDTDEIAWVDKDSLFIAEKCTKNTHKNIVDAMGW